MEAPRVGAVGHCFETITADAFPAPISLGRHELEKEQPPLTADKVAHHEITHHLHKRIRLFEKRSRKRNFRLKYKERKECETSSNNKERPSLTTNDGTLQEIFQYLGRTEYQN
jgi:hypothetical protein